MAAGKNSHNRLVCKRWISGILDQLSQQVSRKEVRRKVGERIAMTSSLRLSLGDSVPKDCPDHYSAGRPGSDWAAVARSQSPSPQGERIAQPNHTVKPRWQKDSSWEVSSEEVMGGQGFLYP